MRMKNKNKEKIGKKLKATRSKPLNHDALAPSIYARDIFL